MSDSNIVSGAFKESPITATWHDNGDRHYFGEALQPPAIEDTKPIAEANSTGSSPLAARADHTHAGVVYYPKTAQTIGIQLSGTYSPGATVATLNVSAKPIPGILMVWAFLRIDKSIATDNHSTDLYSSAGTTTYLAQDYALNYSTSLVSTLHGQTALAANTPTTITMVLSRIAGTGTAQTYANYQHNHIMSLWIPAPS